MNKFLKQYPKLHTFQKGDIVLTYSTPLGDLNMRTYVQGTLIKRTDTTKWEIFIDSVGYYILREESQLYYIGDK